MRFNLLCILSLTSALVFAQSTSPAFEQKLANIQGDVPLEFNYEVNQYILDGIESDKTQEILRKFITYDRMLTDKFVEQGVPTELRFACMSLSDCENNKTLSKGREGFFKMNYRSAKSHGLHISNYVDERRDIQKSAVAFCKEINKIYSTTQDWRSALTIYSCGEANWQKARILSKDTASDFWVISKYLPYEARSEYPKFVAASYLANYYADYGISANPLTIELEQVPVIEYTTLYQLSSRLGVAYQLLQELNPTYKRNIIPSSEKSYMLTLPSSKASMFNNLGSEVYDYVKVPTYTSTEVKIIENVSSPSLEIKDTENENLIDTSEKSEVYYSVRNGDILLKIADLFDCEVVQIQRWNNLNSESLSINQQLVIKVPTGQKSYYMQMDIMTNAERAAVRNKD